VLLLASRFSSNCIECVNELPNMKLEIVTDFTQLHMYFQFPKDKKNYVDFLKNTQVKQERAEL
jgi:hypothetical protein